MRGSPADPRALPPIFFSVINWFGRIEEALHTHREVGLCLVCLGVCGCLYVFVCYLFLGSVASLEYFSFFVGLCR